MKAEIITIGDELLIGQTVDTNSGWIGEQLSLMGIKVHQVSSITDEENHIITALDEASKRAQIIILTGGLGPTKDDLTKHTLCKYFDTELVLNCDVLEKLEGLYKKYDVPFNAVNQEQALLPKACITLPNTRGTASGMWFEKDDIVYISLPGVPHEMKGILVKEGFPKLEAHFDLPLVVHKTVRTMGAPESKLAQILETWENSLVEHALKLAYLPSPGAVRLRVSGEASRSVNLDSIVQQKIDELPELIGDYIYGYEKESIQEVVGNLLLEQGKTLGTAESCTGGSISRLITGISGSSAYFKGSIVSYANEVKVNLLNVSPESIEKHGAVSEQVVTQMANNAREILQADYAVATSGVAGPTGGSAEKPVGTVWIAVAAENEVRSKKLTLPYDHRGRNISVSADYALAFLRSEFLVDRKLK
ncbi:MAG: competence/damage-inducible protein A [Thiotrichaceae bacterium]